jgi:hypothetical protein
MARSIWKRWFRFSLRTLLLAVLLIGSGALLWWNWGPWAPAFSVEAPTPIQDVIFSPDDRFVVFSSWDGDPEAKETKHRLDIRHAASGASHGILLLPHEVSYETIDGSRLWCVRIITEGDRSRTLAPLVYDLQSLQLLDTGAKFNADVPVFWVHHAGEFALLESDKANVLLRWPDLHTVETFPPGRTRLLNDHMFFVHRSDRLELYDALTGGAVKLDAVDGEPEPAGIALGGSRFLLTSVIFGKDFRTELFHIFDAHSGRLLSTREGFMRRASPDGAVAVIHAKLHEAPYVLNVETGEKGVQYQSPSVDVEFSKDSSLFMEDGSCRVFDAKTFSLLWERPQTWARLHPNFVWGMHNQESTPWIAELRTGQTLVDFNTPRWRNYFPDNSTVSMDKDHPHFAIVKENRSTVFRLRRPIEWYGFFWLPEFWMTAVLAAGLAWSIVRDHSEPRPQGNSPERSAQ